MDIPKLNLSAASGQIPWKPIGIALLILLAVALLLYLTTWRANRRLKRELLRLAGAEQAPPTENSAVPETTEPLLASDTTPMDSSPVPAGYPMPILNPGLKFNLQPEFGLPYPAFNAWNTAGTLRVLAVLDTTGSFVTSRESADSEPMPAWVLQLFSAGGALLQETQIPIVGEQPDGKRLVAEIRTLLETGLEESPNTENP
jgi:hypothetical protein